MVVRFVKSTMRKCEETATVRPPKNRKLPLVSNLVFFARLEHYQPFETNINLPPPILYSSALNLIKWHAKALNCNYLLSGCSLCFPASPLKKYLCTVTGLAGCLEYCLRLQISTRCPWRPQLQHHCSLGRLWLSVSRGIVTGDLSSQMFAVSAVVL